ncbi:hypothetical protein B0I37DRAFT_201738 [Chaetomium sp. MPI-CAGE-AT-0009]|nr:hypothetical protein B0I37DRAFT_201738 [Chaetomium sp. MPI-CAGE-AT-0009]
MLILDSRCKPPIRGTGRVVPRCWQWSRSRTWPRRGLQGETIDSLCLGILSVKTFCESGFPWLVQKQDKDPRQNQTKISHASVRRRSSRVDSRPTLLGSVPTRHTAGLNWRARTRRRGRAAGMVKVSLSSQPCPNKLAKCDGTPLHGRSHLHRPTVPRGRGQSWRRLELAPCHQPSGLSSLSNLRKESEREPHGGWGVRAGRVKDGENSRYKRAWRPSVTFCFVRALTIPTITHQLSNKQPFHVAHLFPFHLPQSTLIPGLCQHF